jgi:monoamine oxidase
VSSRIEYDPPLPPARIQLVQRMPLGRTIKCIAVYDKPYWHDRYSGLSIGNTTPVIWTMDHTVPPGPPALMAFVVADHADRLSQRPAAEIERTVCDAIAETFDDARLRLPRRFMFKDWSADPWACGGPTGVTPPGALTAFGPALRRPFGRVHWSGTEAATRWVGYMCGAVAAGCDAAGEVLAAGL